MQNYSRKNKTIGSKQQSIKPVGLGLSIADRARDHASYQHQVNLIKQALELGYQLFDTAPAYGAGVAETNLGQALKEIPRQQVYLATKVSASELAYANVINSVDESLQRLQTDYIDLLQVHWPNPSVPIAETMQAFVELKQQGKVLDVGVCNFSLAEIQAAQQALGNVPLSTVQLEYNLFERYVESEILPYCAAHDIKLLAYSPLFQGRIVNTKEQLALLTTIAEKYQVSAAEVALNWLLSKSNVLVIPNVNQVKYLTSNLQALNFSLDAADMDLLEQQCSTPITEISVQDICVSSDYGRKAYSTLAEALDNAFDYCPSPKQLALELQQKIFLKPIRVIKTNKQQSYDLIEGRLRYWAWVIAFGEESSIPAMVCAHE